MFVESKNAYSKMNQILYPHTIIKEVFENMVDFQKIMEFLWNFFHDIWKTPNSTQEGFLDAIFSPIQDIFKNILKDITSLLDGIADTIEDVKQIICAFNTFPNRFRNLTSGFNNVFNGVGQEFVALGVALNIGFHSVKDLTEYIAEFISTYVGCGFKFASNILDCILYYLFDILRYILYMPIRIIIWLFYATLSIDLYGLETEVWNGLERLDKVLFPILRFHIIHYPASVRNKCYVCKRLKTSAVAAQAKETDRVFREDIPCQFKPGADKIKHGLRQFDEIFKYPLAKHPNEVQ